MDFTRVLQAYEIAPIISVEPWGNGHINKTFDVHTTDNRYILQQINTSVFHNVSGLMENMVFVGKHLKLALARQERPILQSVPEVIFTKSGESFFTDEAGQCYRLVEFVQDSVALQIPQTPRQLYTAGRAFGAFFDALSDVSMDELQETIPFFHDTVVRYQAFEQAVRADACGRVREVESEIAFLRERRAKMGCVTELLANGGIPLRVTHNDTKLNNVLLNKEDFSPLAVIDLDTVMPGSALYDFGDAIRSGTNTAAEDERDLSRVTCDLSMFAAYTEGYLSACGARLCEQERALLVFSAQLMTMECGMRFLTDYLQGDTYFKVRREGQNLDRCRVQLKLVADMEAKAEKMQAIVEDILKKLH